jgi:hypothetical protein
LASIQASCSGVSVIGMAVYTRKNPCSDKEVMG